MMSRSDTIAAISTPYGRGGIGIVRISGPESLAIATKIIKTTTPLIQLSNSKTRKQIHGFLLDSDGKDLDEVLVSIHSNTRSFTGDLAVEINCHGGPVVLDECLKLVLDQGARPAQPGEFTRRAVENGRLDLIQAEAINDFIHSNSKMALKMARTQADGTLSRVINQLKDEIKNVLGEITYLIDVDSEAEAGFRAKDSIQKSLRTVIDGIHRILQSSETRKFISRGYWVVIAGPQNAGKSSLFNAILQSDRSIVCHVPGTTRDHITESIEICGIEVRLIDTAGIHVTNNEVDKLSIEKTLEQIRGANIVLYALDQSKDVDGEQESEAVNIINKGGFIVFNKSDLRISDSAKAFTQKLPKESFIFTSALHKIGIEEIKTKLAMRLKSAIEDENVLVTSARQINLLKTSEERLEKALIILENCGILDQVQYEIENSVLLIEEIVGSVSSEEIWDVIFSKFCIGK